MSNAERHGGIGTSAWITGREFDELQYQEWIHYLNYFLFVGVQLNIE